MSWMSTYVVVEISPETTIRPVLTSVSQATRPYGSSVSTASSTPSEIWSAILSGWPSVTDSEVNRNSLSEWWLIAWKSTPQVSREGKKWLRSLFGEHAGACRNSLRASGGPLACACPTLDEVDDQRHSVHAVAGA